jgi:plastocyanin
MKHLNFNRLVSTITISAMLLAGVAQVKATDGDPIMDLGIFSWIKYQQKTFFTDIVEITLQDGKFSHPEVEVSVYQPIIIENKSTENHRIVFVPGLKNKMDFAYTGPVIKAEERWGLEIHTFGDYPYQCTLHPEERGVFKVTL